ncbi:MAG: hypothetical protein IJR97_00355 [Clostridia bacterium]|nr:hypothetical protein [Clostridia bacterium]
MAEDTGRIFTHPVKAVNIGADLLGEALKQQEVDTVMLDWRPPRQVVLPERIKEILDKLG